MDLIRHPNHRQPKNKQNWTTKQYISPIYYLQYLNTLWCCWCKPSPSSFLDCFGVVHDSLQWCADWDDQVSARNRLASSSYGWYHHILILLWWYHLVLHV